MKVLASLSGRADALKKHLEAHSAQLRKTINQLLKLQNSGLSTGVVDPDSFRRTSLLSSTFPFPKYILDEAWHPMLPNLEETILQIFLPQSFM